MYLIIQYTMGDVKLGRVGCRERLGPQHPTISKLEGVMSTVDAPQDWSMRH